MIKTTRWIWLFVLGSVWGLFEIFGQDFMRSMGLGRYSTWLTIVALLLLAAGRGFWNRLGTSTAIGVFAAIFKLANAAPNYCHLLGILGIAVVFDLAATALLRGDKNTVIQFSVVGTLSALGGAATFALFGRFVFGFPYWVSGGWSKFFDHVAIGGGLAALTAMFLVPLAFEFAPRGIVPFESDGKWILAAPTIAAACIWILAGAG